MKIRRRSWFIIFSATCAGLLCIFLFYIHYAQRVATAAPFQISVADLQINHVPKQMEENGVIIDLDGEEARLTITVSITNLTELDFQNTWFELLLNEEVEPYIASHILKYTSDKMEVTSSEKATTFLSGQDFPLVSGFTHEWNMLLTSEEDLDSYFMLSSDGISNALQSITVNVYWDGGSQSATVPLHLNT